MKVGDNVKYIGNEYPPPSGNGVILEVLKNSYLVDFRRHKKLWYGNKNRKPEDYGTYVPKKDIQKVH